MPPVRLIVGLNVVVLAAASLVRERLSKQASAAIVASVPLLSYYVFFGWRLALAPPRPGEALRPDKPLRECSKLNQLVVALVLTVEFVQFNALSFNPDLGVWGDLRALSSYFSYSFFVFPASSGDDAFYFERQLWVFCALAVGWVLFALVALAIVGQASAPAAAAGLKRSVGMVGPAGACRAASSASSLGAADDEALSSASGAEYTMNSPVGLVVRTIFRTGSRALRFWWSLLLRGKAAAYRLVWGANTCELRCLGRLALMPIAILIVLAFCVAASITLLLGFVVALYCAGGLAVCIAFAAIALLHFPILMNMLSVLNCEYDADGVSGFMGRMPSQPCWEGRHWLFAGASVVTIAMLYPVMIHFERKRQSAAEISYHVRFTSCMVIGKLALSAMSALLLSTLPPAAYLLCCGSMLVFFLHVNNQREQDDQPACCNVRTVRLLRSMIYTCALWSVTTTLASTILDVPDWMLAVALGVLWLLTAAFFIAIILLPQHEPRYRSEPPQLSVTTHAVKPILNSPPPVHTRQQQRAVASPTPNPAEKQARNEHDSHPLPRSPVWLQSQGNERSTERVACELGGGGGDLAGLAGGGSANAGGGCGSANSGGSGISDGSMGSTSTTRTVFMPAQVSARPRVAFYEFDDGFDTSATFSGLGSGGEGEGGGGGAAEEPAADELLAIVLAAQPPSSCGGHAPLSAGAGGGRLLGGLGGGGQLLGAEGGLWPGDIIAGVNGEMGLSAWEVAARLEAQHGALALTVRRATLRAEGGKRSRAATCLRHYPVRYVTQCMMLYPQDAELQRAGCERLCRAVVDASHRSTLPALIAEVRAACVLSIVINAMEVHVKDPAVLTAAARLLSCLANTEGHLRANLVAAGALPALSAALKAHSGSSEVHALCDLAAEVCSARGAPPGSRRAMCESLAATGTLKAVLKALRGHVGHEGVVAASCKVLLAYHEEFEGSGSVPLALTEALCAHGTPTALEEAQRRFLHSTEIQLGAEWAVGVARLARMARGETKRQAASSRAAKRAEPTLTAAARGSPRGVLQPVQQLASSGDVPRAAAAASPPPSPRKKK